MLLKCLAIALVTGALGCGGSTASVNAAASSGEASLDADLVDSASLPDPDRPPPGDAGDALVVLPAQFTEEAMPMRMLAESDPVDLWNAPQGGHVVLFGAKVKNLLSDTATIKVRFRRPDTGLIVAEEGRTVKMVPVPDEPDLMQPDIRSRSQVANVPLCPSYGPLGIVDEPFDVEIVVTALYTQPVQTGEAKIKIVARCSTPDDEAFCRCDCGPDYFLGKCPDDRGRDASPREAAAPEASSGGD